MKLQRKFSLLLVLSLLLLVVLSGTYAYSKYVQGAQMPGQIQVAVWSIKVNGCNIVNPGENPDDIKSACFESTTETDEDDITTVIINRNFKIDEESIVYYPLENDGLIGNNKIAPGTEARFGITIDPGATEAAFKYDLMAKYDDDKAQIKASVIELDCPSGEYDNTCTSIKDENGKEIEHPLSITENVEGGEIVKDNPYQNFIYFSETEDNRKQFLQVKVVWINDDSGASDKSDTEIGTVEKPKLHIPVSIVFQQITSQSDIPNNDVPSNSEIPEESATE